MKSFACLILAIFLTPIISIPSCFSKNKIDRSESLANTSSLTDEIVFYSNGSTFSPVIVLQADAVVLWNWDDNTTSSSLTPTKNYGSEQLRQNRLKVTPWSALRRINICYTAEDGGTNNIELVPDQNVSQVDNLSLVAPYLKEWCSSYNKIRSLDFSNFVNLETVECYNSRLLRNVQFTNTPNLKRACFDDNSLIDFNLKDCNSMQDIRGALNGLNNFTFPTITDKIWHICLWGNPFTNKNLINNLSQFPLIADVLIPISNQQGDFIMPKSHPTRHVNIWAWNNKYTSLDLRGALKNTKAYGYVKANDNEITKVDITGCIQIVEIYLDNNKLQSSAIDQVLKQIDEFGTNNGTVSLLNNQPPTSIGLGYKTNLENKGWTVNIDQVIQVESISVSSVGGTTINTDNGTLQVSASILPAVATNKAVTWSVVNVTGNASISTSGLITAEKDGTVKVVATANDGSGVKGEMLITISNQVIPVESITIIDNLQKDTIFGIGTKLFLKVLVSPFDATNKTITWSVINLTGKASIENDGLLITSLPGTIQVIAKANDGTNIVSTKEYLVVIPNFNQTTENSNSFKVYSNPLNNRIQIHLDKMPSGEVILEIRNLLGQKLHEQKIVDSETNFYQRSSGQLFLITLRNRDKVETKKIIF